MHFFRTFVSLSIVIIALFLTYCTSPTKSKKKVEQSVAIDNIWISDEVDNNENGYYSSMRLNFDVRVTTGEIVAHIAVGIYRESDNALVGYDALYEQTISDTWESYYFDISDEIGDFPADRYWIALLVLDTQNEENVYATATPSTDPELGNLNMEQATQDFSFYLRLNNYTFTEIEFNMEDQDYILPVSGTVKIEFSGNPGSIIFNATTYGKTSDTNAQIGLDLYWEDVVFSTAGLDSLVRDLTIHPDFFFLYMYNSSGSPWSPIDVNVGQSDADYFREYIRIPADASWYGTGYYRKFYNTRVDAYYQDYPSSDPIIWSTVEFTAYWPDLYSNSSFIAALSYPPTAKINTDDILLKALPIGGTNKIVRDDIQISKLNRTRGISVPNTGAR
jgi:hypothetical protein